ncbi:maestro heat-like repeat-containing protein family member 1 [Sitophilus oryzae]|uniref:Maestro heat-like repeat-containing protein family member 1 n=1 Tax=Sitophilus oryzae TaxID=7048 RepID=A0A6J2XIP4_SITOR|nr:maestro heat-like repeat-containing protein family member 1 [Sitophilus oryzae]
MSGLNGKLKSTAETQLQIATGALLESLHDKSTTVCETASVSLLKLSEKYPNQVLLSCVAFFTNNTKCDTDHIVQMLNIMNKICIDQISGIDGDTVIKLIEFGLMTMTKSNNYEPLVQLAASKILVALGRVHYIQVTDALLQKLQIGMVPHYTVPHTLGSLASVNAYGVIRYLKDILNIILPLLGGLKNDHLKESFAYALQNFCEALLEYGSNLEQVPDPTISTETYTTELGMAYDVLFTSWLQSREPTVVESVLEALSAIFRALPIDKVTQQTPRLIPFLLNHIKKNSNAYVVTKCLYSAIEKTAGVNGMLLEPLLSNILSHLSDLVCVSPDYAQPDLLRSHSEVLRCYECLALHFTDITIDKLLGHLKNNNEKEKLKGLIVIAHLISYSSEQAIQRRYRDILKYINELLSDSHIKIKTILVKIITGLAHKGILTEIDLNPDGPERYLEFMLKMCCKQHAKVFQVEGNELEDIQRSADNALYMLTTSMPELEDVLWDLFLNCFLTSLYDNAIVILLRCLTHIASRKESKPNCEAAFVRCIVLLSNPTPSLRGTYIVNFLKNITLYDTQSCRNVWDAKIPQLLKYLEQTYDTLNLVEWQDLLFSFINLLLESINNEAFNNILLVKAKSLLELYGSARIIPSIDKDELQVKLAEKRFLIKFFAVILCHVSSKELVSPNIENSLLNVTLTDYSDLQACAEAMGICSQKHLALVLEKLSHVRKEMLNKKSSKLFSFMKDQRHDLGVERLRYLIIYSYSEICNEALSEPLLRVVESEILDFVLQELSVSKDFAIKRTCLKAIHSVADAMHPNRNSLHIRMNSRDKVIEAVSSQMHLHNGPEYIKLFPLITSAVTALIKLPVSLESEERIKLIKLFFDNIYNASAIYCKINSSSMDSYYGDLKLVPCVTKSFSELNQFVQELILQNLSPATLDELVTLLESWLGKRKAEQRLPAIETLRVVLQTYLDNIKFAYDCPHTFHQTGMLLAKIVPRCTDPNNNIKRVAVDCIYLTLCISSRYEGHMRDHDKVLSNSLQHVQKSIETNDPQQLFNLTSDLANVICQNLPQFQLIHFVEGLIDSLLDCESSSSNGSSVVLNITLKNKGGDLQNHVSHVTERLIAQLDSIPFTRTKTSALRAVVNLAAHHPRVVGGILLMQPLPFSSCIIECWSILSTDRTLVQILLDQIKKHLKTTPLYEEQGNGDIKIASLTPLQALCALHELLRNTHLKDIFLEQFAELFSLLLISLASYIGCTAPALRSLSDKKQQYGLILNRDAYKLSPARIAVETFRLFFLCCEMNNIATNLLAYTDIDTSDNKLMILDIIETLVNNVSSENPQSISWIVACLGPFIRSELEPQKVAVVAFFTYLLKHGAQSDQTVLIENLLEMILDVQLDQSCLVRKIGLEGIGYAAENLKKELVSRYCNQILGVLMNSLDYHSVGTESNVILQALLTLSKLLKALEGYKFNAFQVTAAVRIKPLFTQEARELRQASIRLLGDLTSSLSPESNLEAFKEQIQSNIITLLLHLSDPDGEVIKACKYTLRRVGPYLESSETNQMIQEHLIDEANLHYSDFIKDLIKSMAKEMQDLFTLFVMTSVSYTKSPWSEIRSNAALMTGLLYFDLIPENKQKISLDAVCDKLIRLLRDDSDDVRFKTSQAIAYLFI